MLVVQWRFCISDLGSKDWNDAMDSVAVNSVADVLDGLPPSKERFMDGNDWFCGWPGYSDLCGVVCAAVCVSVQVFIYAVASG
jgi:hypothetical protein